MLLLRTCRPGQADDGAARYHGARSDRHLVKSAAGRCVLRRGRRPARHRRRRIKIAISADTVKEGDEAFTVALSNASGAALAAPRTETVTIQDRTQVRNAKLKVRLFRVLRFAIASDADGAYRYKLTVTAAHAKKLGLKRRTLASSGSRSLHSGANTLSLTLGGKLKAKLHKAKIKPTLTIALGDGTTVRQRVAL
jgi:hypothetical protein